VLTDVIASLPIEDADFCCSVWNNPVSWATK